MSSLSARPGARLRIGLLLGTCLLAATPALAQVEQSTAALGIGTNHGSLSFAPWEQIDAYTGNVLLTFTDIDLPGNAGFNLTIRRHYNSKNRFYPYFDYGFPTVCTSPKPCIGAITYPVIEMPDGSRIRMLQDLVDPSVYLTTSRWRYLPSTPLRMRTLETPDWA